MPRSRNRKKTSRKERTKLITYLGARTQHRFESKRPLPSAVLRHRVQLCVALAVLAALAAWGLWLEFAI